MNVYIRFWISQSMYYIGANMSKLYAHKNNARC